MAKVTFEFDEYDDRDDINIIVNREKLTTALEKVADLRHKIYNSKFYSNEMIGTKDGKVLAEEDYEDIDTDDVEYYVSKNYLDNTLETILDGIYDYLNY